MNLLVWRADRHRRAGAGPQSGFPGAVRIAAGDTAPL